MTQTSAGWYPDPDPTDAGGHLRYWDGIAWTQHRHGPVPVMSTTPIQYGQPYGQQFPPYVYQPPVEPTTPDGQPLAGWWQRVLAQFIDGCILTPFYVALAIPFVVSQWDELTAWMDEIYSASESDTTLPAIPDLLDPTSFDRFLFSLMMVALVFAYNTIFLRWKQATPGKLIVGLRIRRREAPGPLPWSTILARVGTIVGISVLTSIPWLGLALSPLALVNYLWPLWDDKKQTLHDKVAGTNVVRVR